MIASLLIANRGEIACRIIRTCRSLGIRTVAVFSEADANSLHVALADEKHCVGPAQARASYLDAERIVAAALEHAVAAVHPGYGFLAERPDLPELCERHGLLWVGPSAHCIRLMGSKIEAKRVASAAGVRSVPGYAGSAQSCDELLRQASTIGFPVLIKASAGGGGKGMRRVDEPQAFAAALELAKREAGAAFGDDSVLLEKYIVRPRHIEVQLAGDKHGNLIHLLERECSIQRNYQKVLEEAPAPRLAGGVREKLFDRALRLGRAIGYDSLGTVEFLLDADQGDDAEPYFLEMNTRLQVEHPVTEAVTGLDLVALQLQIAAGKPLPMRQCDIRACGHAIEVRVAAEDPTAAYRPQIGQIHVYREPSQRDGVRFDSGVRAGSHVTPHYDSLLAKLIASGPDRETATLRLRAALGGYVILGVQTNCALLRDIIQQPTFLDGALTTRFIADAFPGGFLCPPPDALATATAAIAALLASTELDRERVDMNPWIRFAGFRVLGRAGRASRCRYNVSWRDAPARVVALTLLSREHIVAETDGTVLDLEVSARPDGLELRQAGRPESALCHVQGTSVYLHLRGRTDSFVVRPMVEVLAEKSTARPIERPHLSASLTGLIVGVEVREGDTVAAGQVLVVMEAMKLVHAITAPLAGVVGKIHCVAGQIVTSGTRLIDIDAQPGQRADINPKAES